MRTAILRVRTELDPLSPSLLEVGFSVLALLHLLLLAFVVVQLLRGKLAVPQGVFGAVVLLALPVIGPLLVLTWQWRVDRTGPPSGA